MTTAAHNGTRLRELAAFIRSKNAGPFMLTIDIFFVNSTQCERVLNSGALAPETVADIYGLACEDVRVIHLPQADALKISFPRRLTAGDIGDRDVAGGQQFAPLLNLVVPSA